MKKYTIILGSFLMAFMVYASYSTMKTVMRDGDQLWVTIDDHPDWIAWMPGDDQIAFISSHTGKANLYSINLKFLPIETSKGIYVSRYIKDLNSSIQSYYPITAYKDTALAQPEWAPNSKEIAVLAKKGNQSDNELAIINLRDSNKIYFTGVKGIKTINWQNDDEILYVSNKKPTVVMKYVVKTKATEEVMSFEQEINGIAGRQTIALIAYNNGVHKLNLKHGKLETFPMPINCAKVYHLNKMNFLVRNNDGDVVVFDLNNQKTTRMFDNGGFGNVTISTTKNFIATTNPTLGGIVIKKIPNPYRENY